MPMISSLMMLNVDVFVFVVTLLIHAIMLVAADLIDVLLITY